MKRKVQFQDIIYNLFVKQVLSNIKMIGILCLLINGGTTLKAQQEPMYSQYQFNLLQINPAYAGNRAVNNITTLFRKQWVGIEDAPSTCSLSWDQRQKGSNVGYGLQIYHDQLGIEATSGIQAFYSFHIAFRESSLSLGVSGGMLNYRASFSQVTTTVGGDPLFQEDVNGWLPTAGVGMIYATNNWYAAISVPALLQTKINSLHSKVATSADKHYFLTGGYIFEVSDVLKLKPSILVKAVNAAPLECDINLNAWIQDVVGLGASYRTGDALIGMFELQISPELRLGYAFDYTISNLQHYSKGTHELMLRYEFNNHKDNRVLSPRYY